MSFIKKYNIEILFLSIVLLTGVFLRFYGLDIQSLWNDELDSWANATVYSDIETIIRQTQTYEPHPPLYWVFLHIYIKIIGADSELVLRLPSAIASSLSIFLLIYLAYKYFNLKTALYSALFFSINYETLLYAQQARGNSIAILLSLVGFYLFLDIFINKKKTRHNKLEIAYFFITLLSIYFHYSALFFYVGQGLFGLYLCIKNYDIRKKFFIIYSLVSVFYLPQVFVAFNQAEIFYTKLYPNVNTTSVLLFLEYVSGGRVLSFFTPLVFFFSLFYGFSLFLKKGNNIKKAFVLCGFFPIFFIFFWSFLFNSILAGRNALCGISIFYIFMGYCFSEFLEKIFKKKHIIVFVILFAVGLYDILFNIRYYEPNRLPSWRNLTKYLAANFNSDDYIIVGHSYGRTEYYQYYKKRYNGVDIDYAVWKEPNLFNTYERILNENPNKKIIFVGFERRMSRQTYEKVKEKYNLKLKKNFKHIYDIPNPIRVYEISKKQ